MNTLYQNLFNKALKKLDWIKKPTKVFEKNLKNKINWFPDGELNIGYNCLDKHLNENSKDKAIIYESPILNESGFYSYKQLYKKVDKYCNFLNTLNLKSEDKVIIYMPNIPESIIFKLALSKINITYHSISISIGENELNKRLKEVNPKYVITASSGIISTNIIDLVDNLNKIYKEHGYIKTIVFQRDAKKSKLENKTQFLDLDNEIEKLNNDLIIEEKDDINNNLYIFKDEENSEYLLRDHKGYAISSVLSMQRNFGTIKNDIVLCTNFLSTSLGQTYSLYGPLLLGATSFLIENEWENPKDYLDLIKKYEVNILLGKENLIDNILEVDNIKEELSQSQLKTIVYHDWENINTKKSEFENIFTCKMLYQNEIGYPIFANSFINKENNYKLNYGLESEILNNKLYLKTPYFPSIFTNTLKDSKYYENKFQNELYNLNINVKVDGDNIEVQNEETDYYNSLHLKININDIENILNKDENIINSSVIVEDELENTEELIIFIETNNSSIFDSDYLKNLKTKLINEFGKLLKIKDFIIIDKIPQKEGKNDKEVLENIFYNKESLIEDKYKYLLEVIHKKDKN